MRERLPRQAPSPGRPASVSLATGPGPGNLGGELHGPLHALRGRREALCAGRRARGSRRCRTRPVESVGIDALAHGAARGAHGDPHARHRIAGAVGHAELDRRGQRLPDRCRAAPRRGPGQASPALRAAPSPRARAAARPATAADLQPRRAARPRGGPASSAPAPRRASRSAGLSPTMVPPPSALHATSTSASGLPVESRHPHRDRLGQGLRRRSRAAMGRRRRAAYSRRAGRRRRRRPCATDGRLVHGQRQPLAPRLRPEGPRGSHQAVGIRGVGRRARRARSLSATLNRTGTPASGRPPRETICALTGVARRRPAGARWPSPA